MAKKILTKKSKSVVKKPRRLLAKRKKTVKPFAPKTSLVNNFSDFFQKKKEIDREAKNSSEFIIKRTKIKIIGLGGGGSNIVAGIAAHIKKASFCLVNTDLQALSHNAGEIPVFQFGEKFTQGLGTGMNPSLAQEAARSERERIKKLLSGNDLVILVASLGGGAGSGAAPVFAQISKSLGNLTYGIFTMPFAFEGGKKEEIAKNTLEQIRPYLNAVSVLPNELVFQVVPKTTPFAKTMSFINDALAKNLEGLIEVIYEPGIINIDFADLKTMLSVPGKTAFLNTLEFQKNENGEIESFENVFSSPLYPYGIDKARGLLINISGPKDLKLSQVNKILSSVGNRIHKDAKIILGVSQVDSNFNGVRVTVFATGCTASDNLATNQVLSDSKNEKNLLLKKSNSIEKPIKAEKKSRKKTKKISAKKHQRSQKKTQKIEIKAKLPDNLITDSEKTKIENDNVVNSEDKDEQDGAINSINVDAFDDADEKTSALRKNAIDVKKEIEEEENAMLAKEKAWEIPAFLRRQKK